MVPQAGFEPARPCGQQILSLSRLPFRHTPRKSYYNCVDFIISLKSSTIVNNFIKFARFDKGEKITIDGLRVNFEDGWGLLRASNTTPKLVLRFEAKSQKRLIEIQNLFLSQLKLIDESIEIKIS